MRRRRRIKATGGVQMFSFLDAMICTMGALLVLLHAFARHGEEEIAQTQTQVTDAELQTQREELQWRIDQLKQSRDKTEAQLAAERLKLSHVEDHERRLRQKFEQLQIAAKELDRVNSAVDRDARQAEAELAAAKDAVLDAQTKLKDAREKAQEVEPTYSVVPYEGAHATSRRPVYIECRAQSVVLQPEGIELSSEDFAGFLGPGNPLASALRGAREYFASQGATKNGVEPYPLLLVRPDGIEAYYAARAALTSWGSDFGYELVGGDWKLKFPEPDPRLAELTKQIVAEARERQAEYLASAPPSRSRSRPKYHARSQGGFVQERGSGGGAGGGDRGGWDSLGSNWGQGKSKRGSAGSDGNGSGDGQLAGADGGAGTGLEPGGSGVPGGDSLLGSGNGGPDGKYGGGPGGAVDRYGQPIDGSPAAGELSPENAPYGAADGQGGMVAGNRAVGGAKGKSDGTARSGSSRGGQPGEPGAEGSGENSDPLADAAAGGQAGARGSKTGSASGSPGGAKSAAGGAQSQSSNAEGSQFSAGSGTSSESSGQPPSLGAPPLNINSPQGKKVKSMAQARGRDWGLPNAEPHAVAANRPLLVECHNDRLIIPSADRSEPPKEIRLGANTQDSMDDLVSGVWKHIESWGLAGRGMYWKPELVMEVKPGAADRYAEIKGLLADSGLEVRERQPRPATKPAPRKSTRR